MWAPETCGELFALVYHERDEIAEIKRMKIKSNFTSCEAK